MYCGYCGYNMDDDASFCRNCGKPNRRKVQKAENNNPVDTSVNDNPIKPVVQANTNDDSMDKTIVIEKKPTSQEDALEKTIVAVEKPKRKRTKKDDVSPEVATENKEEESKPEKSKVAKSRTAKNNTEENGQEENKPEKSKAAKSKTVKNKAEKITPENDGYSTEIGVTEPVVKSTNEIEAKADKIKVDDQSSDKNNYAYDDATLRSVGGLHSYHEDSQLHTNDDEAGKYVYSNDSVGYGVDGVIPPKYDQELNSDVMMNDWRDEPTERFSTTENNPNYYNQYDFPQDNYQQDNYQQDNYQPDNSIKNPPAKSGSAVDKILAPLIIAVFIAVIGLLGFLSYNMNWFGVQDFINEKFSIGEDASEDDEEYDEEDDDTSKKSKKSDNKSTTTAITTTTTTETTTQPVTETTTAAPTQTGDGSANNPFVIQGAKNDYKCSTNGTSNQSVVKIIPSKTGYYYIRIPKSTGVNNFSVYVGANNDLEGNSETHKEGSVNEEIYYDMFYAGETYFVYIETSSQCDFTVTFVDRTNDKNRTITAGVSQNLTNQYTYLRAFTPTTSGTYTVTISPSSGSGEIHMYDANWTELDLVFSESSGKYVSTQYYEKGKKYSFVISPSSDITFSLSAAN